MTHAVEKDLTPLICMLAWLCSSGFLVGPKQQVKLMMKPVRRIAAFIYLSMIIVVLAIAIAV